MKKSLCAVLALTSAAGIAAAADVQIYGLINPSLTYVHIDDDLGTTTDSFSMEEGKEFGSRWGLRGMEKISDSLKVGFVLESGFSADTGSLFTSGRVFDRESHLDIYTDYGKFTFGRMPLFGSVLGADGLFRAIEPLFSNLTLAYGLHTVTGSNWTRVDNAISYVTPSFNGFTGYAMYSFKTSGATDAEESKAESDRYASLAIRYKNGPLEAVLVGDTTMYGSVDSPKAKVADIDYGYTLTLGGNYAFDGGIKLFAFGQIFEDQYLNALMRGGISKGTINKISPEGYGYVSGYGVGFGTHNPLAGGTLKTEFGYRDMDNEAQTDFRRWFAAATYDYPMSKRTTFYVHAGYAQEKIETKTTEANPSGFESSVGIVHTF